jgi:hypothetical protein
MKLVSVLETFCYDDDMSPEYPYQLVAFLGDEPEIGEGVYQGEKGWYPQIALKRRFSAASSNETNLLSLLSDFTAKAVPLQLQTGKLVKPDRMPVRVIDILNKNEIKRFHLDFINYMGARMESRYPERDGENYLPHITAEYNDNFVIDVNRFALKAFVISKICLIKDEEDTDSHVVAYFNLEGGQ